MFDRSDHVTRRDRLRRVTRSPGAVPESPSRCSELGRQDASPAEVSDPGCLRRVALGRRACISTLRTFNNTAGSLAPARPSGDTVSSFRRGSNPEPHLQAGLGTIRRGANATQTDLNMADNSEGPRWHPGSGDCLLEMRTSGSRHRAGSMSSPGRELEIFPSGRFGVTFMGF